ncbi:hypothetical protein NIES2111_31790 [Nostoc sp. NIES-2111]|nr:hypothetical protein NIES2111_31790 [Nostoc sp. NIES-2111]
MNRRNSLQWIIVFSILVISGFAYLSNQFIFSNVSKNKLETAQKNWNRKNISHYRLTINYSSPNNCQQEVEIKDDKIISVKQNTCISIPPSTVTELFKQIEAIADAKECGPNGCACDGTLGVDADYNPQFGYPLRVTTRLQPQKRWLYFNSLSDIYPGKPCTLIGFVNQEITVSKFTPI